MSKILALILLAFWTASALPSAKPTLVTPALNTKPWRKHNGRMEDTEVAENAANIGTNGKDEYFDPVLPCKKKHKVE